MAGILRGRRRSTQGSTEGGPIHRPPDGSQTAPAALQLALPGAKVRADCVGLHAREVAGTGYEHVPRQLRGHVGVVEQPQVFLQCNYSLEQSREVRTERLAE
jgi:hypothetical protein